MRKAALSVFLVLIPLVAVAAVISRSGASAATTYEGAISEVSDSAIVLKTYCGITKLEVTPDTQVVLANGEPGTIADLALGDWVRVEADGLTATRIEVTGQAEPATETPGGSLTPSGTFPPRPRETPTTDVTPAATFPTKPAETPGGSLTPSGTFPFRPTETPTSDVTPAATFPTKPAETAAGSVTPAATFPTRPPATGTADPEKVYFSGTVCSASETSLSVQTGDGATVDAVMAPETVVRHQDGSEASIADLTPGQFVNAWGTNDGTVTTVLQIEIQDGVVSTCAVPETATPQPSGSPEPSAATANDAFVLHGMVCAFDGTVLEVMDDGGTVQAVTVTAQTTVEHQDGRTGSTKELTPGLFVTIQGTTDGESMTAEGIVIEDGVVASCPDTPVTPQPMAQPTAADGEVYLHGSVCAFDGTTLDVLDDTGVLQAVTVSSDTQITHQDGSPATSKELTPGQSVSVWGAPEGDAIVAKQIEIEDGVVDTCPCPGTVTGSVIVSSSESLTVSQGGYPLVIKLDAPTAAAAGDRPAPGSTVQIDGNWYDDGTFTATTVTILDPEDHGYSLAGVVASIDGSGLTIDTGAGSFSLGINDATTVTRESGEQASLSDVVAGLYVVATTELAAEPTASTIVIVDVRIYQPERANSLGGTVRAVNRRTMVLTLRQAGGRLTPLRIDAKAWISHADGSAAGIEDVRPGIYVDLSATRVGARLVAGAVHLYDTQVEAGVVRRLVSDASGTRFVLKVAGKHGRRLVRLAAGGRVVDGAAVETGLHNGDAVLVEAVGSGARWVANRVTVVGSRGGLLRASGSVERVTKSAVVLKTARGGLRLPLGPRTLVLRSTGRAVDRTSLHRGANVVAVGLRVEGRPVALLVRVVPRH